MSASTQLLAARRREITPEMQMVAEQEFLPPESIREQIAAGRLVIPANRRRPDIRYTGIGRALRTKVNVNLGNSALTGDPAGEQAKLDCAIKHGADAVMDLSTGPRADEIRAHVLRRSRVPVGTVPVYQALSAVEDPLELTEDRILDVIARQADEGVDFMTVHAGLRKAQLPAARQRVLGIVSRGGSILARWMQGHDRENPFYTRFDNILELCKARDVTLSLGDGMRPGCLADASDAAQFAELDVLAELVHRSRAAGVQVMVEGPGHIPLDEVEMNMRRERELCDDAPFYILGPVVTDCAPGYDHITSAIGAALGAFHGAAMLCCVTPMEHLGLPDLDGIRAGVLAYKIAAHAADIGLSRPHARERDDAISRARMAFDWEAQFALALDPEHARALRAQCLRQAAPNGCHQAQNGTDQDYCTMCGPKFCSMRINRQLRAEGQAEGTP